VNWTIAAPIIIVAGALVIIGLERLRPYDHQPLWRPGLAVDLIGYALFQSAVLSFVINGLVRAIDNATGASHHGVVSDWPFAAQVALFVVTHDFYIYWFHRAQHRFPILWRLHEAHHSALQVDWLAGARSHALEIVINQTVEVSAMVLLGASPDVMLCKGAISVVWGMWIHANIDVHTGWLQRIINGPEVHRWHHAIDYKPPGKNFATKFAFWDYLFRTVDRPPSKPAGYGLGAPFPSGFWAQQAFAFRRFEPAPPTAAAAAEPAAASYAAQRHA
jgi:sterol desaturase/sphingolipid hydroxylase (fatty acid hydroxylase superfamily)